MSFLDRNHTIAKPGFSRWMVPPAALCVHLCIGQAYAFSVFNLPMTKLIGITQSAPDDWKLTELGWIFSIAIFFLGVSSAVFGRWVEEGGPRRAMFTAALCWAGGFFISAIGVYIHNLWLVYLGYGVLGGMRARHRLHLAGLDADQMVPRPSRHGDRHGHHGLRRRRLHRLAAVGLADEQVHHRHHVGVAETFIVARRRLLRLHDRRLDHRARAGAGLEAGRLFAADAVDGLITTNDVFVYDALKTPQFWLIWWILCLNVTAGIGVLGQASAMSQEMFPGHITPVAAAGFVGLMSLFNMGGRFFWASTSDYIGRKNTYFVFMVLGFLLYCTVPYTGSIGSVVAFVCCFLVIISMYGGGFATVPAYLRDMFGTRYVGAIHGLLLTAWSMAGIFGPVLVNYIREYNVTHGVPKAQAYNITMYIMAGLLVIGFICNFLVKAVHHRFHMQPDHEAERARSKSAPPANRPAHKEEQHGKRKSAKGTTTLQLVLAWGFVGIPLTLGVLQTLVNSMKLFQ